MKYNSILLLSAVIAGIIGCADTSTTDFAGGTVIPNLVNGNVMFENGKPAAGVTVTLRNIVITPSMDSVLEEKTAITNESGVYSFEGVQKGKYVITGIDSAKTLLTAIAKFNKWIDSTQVCATMLLRPAVSLCGRILSDDTLKLNTISVFIPGLSGRVSVDKNGVYTLHTIPVGDYDLCLASGNTANYLPIQVTVERKDTVFIQDVFVDFTEGNIADPYSFHTHTFDYSYTVLPRWYKPGFEPAWYKNKDFLHTSYYAVVNGIFNKYKPDHTVLFVTGTNYSWDSDYKLKDRLQRYMGLSVFMINNSVLKMSDTAGMDVIYLSSSLPSDTSNTLFRNVHVPVVASEAYYFHDLGMTDSVPKKDFGFSDFNGVLTIADPGHFLAAGLKDSVSVLFNSGYFAWGKPAQGAKIIAYKRSLDTALIFCFERGSQMVGMKAPARRVAFFFDRTNSTVRYLNDNGWKLFEAGINWAMGKTSEF